MSLSSFAQRTVSTLILGPLLLGSIFMLEGAQFSLLLGGLLAPAAWEWARLAGQEQSAPRLLYTAALLFLFSFMKVFWSSCSCPFFPPVQYIVHDNIYSYSCILLNR